MARHSPEPRPTLRHIAAAAGVSVMTVSLALRNHPRIPETTRKLVQAAADRLGYRPDPALAKLMKHLRLRRKPAYQATIAALTTIPEGEEEGYTSDILVSVRQRAAELGYGLNLFRLRDSGNKLTSLQRTLRGRGVEGLLLLPVVTPRSLKDALVWDEFSVITATYGVLAPEFHRVVPHQFGNALLLCLQLAKKGYRRIGLVLPAEQDLRVHHGFSAAVAWQNLIGGTEFVRPLIHAGRLPNDDVLAEWFKKERPDAIITKGDESCRGIAQQLGLRIPGKVGFASANKAGSSFFAGIDEQPREIGAAAVEQLAGLIERGEKGVPKTPKVMMIDGRWIDGETV